MIDVNTQQIRTQYFGDEAGISFAEKMKFGGLCLFFFLIVVGLGWIRGESQDIAYQIEAMKSENLKLEQEVRQLRIEYKTMTSPAAIEKYAKSAGLINPNSPEVLILERPLYPADQAQVAVSRNLPEVMHE